MSIIMVDIESDGPIPGDFSMVSFGAVMVNEQLDQTFYGQQNPSANNGFLRHWPCRVTAGRKPWVLQNLLR